MLVEVTKKTPDTEYADIDLLYKFFSISISQYN